MENKSFHFIFIQSLRTVVVIQHFFVAGQVRFILLTSALLTFAIEEIIFLKNLSSRVTASVDVALVQVADEDFLAGADISCSIHNLKNELDCRFSELKATY